MFRHGAEKGRCHVGVIRHRKSDTLMERLLWPCSRARENYPFAAPDGERPVFAHSCHRRPSSDDKIHFRDGS